MRHTGSILAIILFISLSYFIFPHSFSLLPQKVSANKIQNKPMITLPVSTSTQRVQIEQQVVPPTNIPSPIPTITKTVSQNEGSLDSVQNDLLQQVNAYRRSQGLSEVTTNAVVCDFANTRAVEISSNFSHDGFTMRMQNKTFPYSTYSNIVENIAMNTDSGAVVASWINSSAHAANLRADTTYGCIGHSGNYYAYEGWKP